MARSQTPLDALVAAMQAAPEDEAARRRCYAQLLSADLVLALAGPAGQTAAPRLVDLDAHRIALVFDSEARFADLDGPPDYLAIEGRALVALLAEAGLGLGLNMTGEGTPLHLSPDAVRWLAEQAGDVAHQSDRIEEISPPARIHPALLATLDSACAALAGLAQRAHLVTLHRASVEPSLGLVIESALPPMRGRIAGQVAESLKVAGDQTPLDVVFADPGDPLLLAALKHGLAFDLPQPEAPRPPGSDPDTPPRLH